MTMPKKGFFSFKKKENLDIDQDKSILDFQNAEKYCTKMVKDFDFYSYTIGKAYPAQIRPYYFGYHAFFIELRKARFASREQSVSQMRLTFWEDALNDAISGKEGKEPIGVLLTECLKKTAVQAETLQRMVAFQYFDLEREGQLSSMEDLEIYAENIRSLLLYMNLNLLRVKKYDAYLAASTVGRGVGIVDILRKTPALIKMDTSLMPEELMNKHSVNHLEISNRSGRFNEGYFDVVLEVAGRAKALIEEGRSMSNLIGEPGNLALLNAVDSYEYLIDLEEYNFNVFEHNLQKLKPIKLGREIMKIGKEGKF